MSRTVIQPEPGPSESEVRAQVMRILKQEGLDPRLVVRVHVSVQGPLPESVRSQLALLPVEVLD